MYRMNPKHHHVWKNIYACFESGVLSGKIPPPEIYQPYLLGLIKLGEEARKKNPGKTICISFAIYRKEWRDYIRRATSEPVSFALVKVAKSQIVPRLVPRCEA